MLSDDVLLEKIRCALPVGLDLRVYHITTPVTASPALFSAAPNQEEEPTQCVQHLIAFAIPGHGSVPTDLLIYALEIHVYITKNLVTTFVSKADSSGFAHLANLPKGSPSIIRGLTTSVLECFIAQRPVSSKLVLSLFARSQHQYLFPGSIENTGKHLLDDRQLIKWWCRILDAVIDAAALSPDQADPSSQPSAYLVVPGCDNGETRAFFPQNTRQTAAPQPRWTTAYPLEKLVTDIYAPPRCLIPRFPDDPKARFLDDLDTSKDDDGWWRSVRTLDQFWEMMSFRQECSAGRLVGFIWAIFEGREMPNKNHVCTAGLDSAFQHDDQPVTTVASLPTPAQSQTTQDVADLGSSLLPLETLQPIDLPKSPTPSSPILQAIETVSQERPTLQNSKPAEISLQHGDVNQGSLQKPGELVIDSDAYNTLMDYLLELDFATESVARESSTKWIDKAACLAGTSKWGTLVTGCFQITPPTTTSEPPSYPSNTINVLTAVRKKRKVDPAENNGTAAQPSKSDSNLLATNLIRKKPKV